MKRILVLIGIGTCFNAFSQDNPKPPSKNASPYVPKIYLLEPKQPRIMIDGQVVNFPKDSIKVLILSLDNMPCVIPDTSQYHMPVSKPNVVYTIPNPAFPGPQANKKMISPERDLRRLFENNIQFK